MGILGAALSISQTNPVSASVQYPLAFAPLALAHASRKALLIEVARLWNNCDLTKAVWPQLELIVV
ncbi:MAG: hypothetical protein HC894_14455 [Microcoleus sp. SM1_3_4]|nr:hypothetical protein [Microcoleus sp. SM1_3_4]